MVEWLPNHSALPRKEERLQRSFFVAINRVTRTLRGQKAKKYAGGMFFSFLMRSPVPKCEAFGWTSR